MALEVRKELATQEADVATGLVREKVALTLDQPADSFNEDVKFQGAVSELLKTKRAVQLATLLQEDELARAFDKVQPLQGNVVDLSKWDLSEGSTSSRLVVEWMANGAGGLTRLVLDASKACAEVLAALHTLVAATKTLIDLSMMETGAPNLNVLQLNGVEPVESINMSGKQLGPVSAAVIAVCVCGNTSLTRLDISYNALCRVWTDEYSRQQGTYDATGIQAIADALSVNASLRRCCEP